MNNMKIEILKNNRIEDFVKYCRKYRKVIDDSFLYDEDLDKFKPDDENPTFIITNQQGEIAAAASLIIDDYNRRGRKGRFRILHSEIDDINCYSMLMEAILNYTEGLDKLFVFIPLVNVNLIKSIEQLNFKAERYSFILVRENLAVPEFKLPKDYEIKTFRPGIDEETWCSVRNAGFAKLKGCETPMTFDMVINMISSDVNIEGGLKILYHKDKPVGVVRGTKDEYEDSPIMNIGPLAIIPEYQGKGLGRILLRYILNFAEEQSYKRTILCVNAENERAKALYIKEGFKQTEGAVCYRYDLG
jgi:mycothiol synthase